ncbi:MAG: phage tail protein [Thermoanaerobaculia bacterium]
MRTRKCLMPDTGLYVYSTNIWDQWYDFARWSEGKALPATRIDAASFVAARNADQAAGRKAESHLLLLDESSTDDVIQTFRLMARAFWFWDATQFRVVADRPATPLATYGDAHVSKSSLLDLDRSDVDERPNKVTVWYTDTTNGWQLVPMSLATAAVESGDEEPIEEDYRLPHLHDPAQVRSLLTYLLNSRQFDVRIRERWLASTADRRLGDVVTRAIPSRGLSVPVRLLRRTKNTDNTFDVELFEYNAAKFAEHVVEQPSKVQSTFPDPTAAPPDVAAASVTWTEEQYATASGDWLPKGTIEFAAPEDYPWIDTFEVWVSINGSPSRHWFDTANSPALTPALYETGTYALTIKTRNRVTREVSSGTTVSVLVTGVTGVVPEIVDVGGTTETRYWSPPQARSIARYGASFWTHSGLTSFAAAQINDGVLTSTCASSPAGNSWLLYDAGIGHTKAFRELTYYHAGTLVSAPAVEWSDDGANWSSTASRAARESFDAGSGITGRQRAWADAGAHRYWRVTFSGANTWCEFHFAEFLGTYAHVREFRVYDMRSGSRILFTSIPANALPTSASPLTVAPIMTSNIQQWNTSGQALSDVLTTVVNSAGVESAGVRSMYLIAFDALGGNPSYVPQQENSITVASGVNAAVALPPGPGYCRLTGASGALSVGGFASAPGGGTLLIACNATAHAMTVLHENPSSSIDQRITTSTGANVIVPSGGVALFAFDSVAQRWRLFSTPVSRIVDFSGTFGSIDVQSTTNGYAGIRFTDAHEDATLLLSDTSDRQGIYRHSTGAWSWYFQNGILVVGSVPWSNITSRPTTLSGYGITDAAPLASPIFTGNPTAPTPITTDNDTSVATTAFVRNAITTFGSSLNAVTSLSPNSYSNVIPNGLQIGTSTPRGPAVNTTTFSNSTVTVANVTGRGKLRFLSLGRSVAGNVTLTVSIDGANVINAAAYSISGTLGTYFNVPVVGGVNFAMDAASNSYLWAVLDEEGLPFTSSLVITASTSSATAYVAHAYKLLN